MREHEEGPWILSIKTCNIEKTKCVRNIENARFMYWAVQCLFLYKFRISSYVAYLSAENLRFFFTFTHSYVQTKLPIHFISLDLNTAKAKLISQTKQPIVCSVNWRALILLSFELKTDNHSISLVHRVALSKCAVKTMWMTVRIPIGKEHQIE